ncbi:MAG TPA: hypothetical protein VLD65_10715 [Anaerolineales bacterium]|nr:hypothetical protein [Anaerolineales bacterium]
MKHNPGIGATDELCQRVSVAILARVVFKHPSNGEWMLALERKATLRENKVEVKSQPFGGAIRILDLDAIHDMIGDFHFDSERSRTDQDFRLFIRPSTWPVLREFCIQRLSLDNDPILETDPTRELVEEFADALKINLQPEQYASKPVATVVENEATPTENIHARGIHTVRVYRIFETTITYSALAHAMLKNSESLSHKRICELALEDARNGGKGRANAVLALPLKGITDTYLALSPEERNSPIFIEKNGFDETVPAVLEGVTVLKYQRL